MAYESSPKKVIYGTTTNKNGVKWGPVDPNETNHNGITGTQLTILGPTNTMIKFSSIKRAQKISTLVCQEEGEESLIDLDSLKNMGIIHKD